MSFTVNIPQSGQSLGQTVNLISGNFANYAAVIAVNHLGPNGTGAGKHNLSEYVVQAQSPATSTNEVATYCRNGTHGSTTPELYLQQQNQTTGANDIQMSRLDAGTKFGTAGWTFLPGGFIMQWGSCGVVNGAFTTVYTAHGGIAFKVQTYQVFLMVNDPASSATPPVFYSVNELLNSPTQFQGRTNMAITLSYLAIGI